MMKHYFKIFICIVILISIYISYLSFPLLVTTSYEDTTQGTVKSIISEAIVVKTAPSNQVSTSTLSPHLVKDSKSVSTSTVRSKSSTKNAITTRKPVPQPNQHFEKFEQSICYGDFYDAKFLNNDTFQYHDCPKNGIVTVQQTGRLGNVMWEYSATWVIARTTGLKPYVPRCIRKQLDEIFESLSIPTLAQIIHCPLNSSTFVRSHKSWNYGNQSIFLPTYAQITSIIVPWLTDLRQEFRFRKHLLDQADNVLRTAAKTISSIPVYIGVHIRRTDYFHHLEVVNNIKKGAMPDYFFKAMKYYESKYPSALFIVVSDDPGWCRQTFKAKKNVYVASNKNSTAAQDMVIMSVCNHSLIDYGTFGQWSSFLAGGETVYYKSESILDDIAEMLPNWHHIP